MLGAAEIPTKGHLIISKVVTPQTRTTATDNGFPALYNSNTKVIHGIWVGMPDLEVRFGEESGTILLKASQINVDTDSSPNP